MTLTKDTQDLKHKISSKSKAISCLECFVEGNKYKIVDKVIAGTFNNRTAILQLLGYHDYNRFLFKNSACKAADLYSQIISHLQPFKRLAEYYVLSVSSSFDIL